MTVALKIDEVMRYRDTRFQTIAAKLLPTQYLVVDDDTALTLTVKAGDHPPALAAGQGDLAVTVAFGTVQFIGPFESGRFVQSDGSMLIESTTTTGTITAFKVPRNT